MLASIFAVFIAAAIAFAVFEPLQVLPRLRLAPGFALVDEDGELFSSEMARGSITLYAFSSLDCGDECDALNTTMESVAQRVPNEVDLGEVDFQLVTVVLNPSLNSTEFNRAVNAGRSNTGRTDSAVPWTFATADDATLRTIVGTGFRRYYEFDADAGVKFDPGFVLVDGAGVVRGDYRYSTLANDADKLVRHLQILGGELRHSTGPASAAYEAAHLFLCYP